MDGSARDNALGEHAVDQLRSLLASQTNDLQMLRNQNLELLGRVQTSEQAWWRHEGLLNNVAASLLSSQPSSSTREPPLLLPVRYEGAEGVCRGV